MSGLQSRTQQYVQTSCDAVVHTTARVHNSTQTRYVNPVTRYIANSTVDTAHEKILRFFRTEKNKPTRQPLSQLACRHVLLISVKQQGKVTYLSILMFHLRAMHSVYVGVMCVMTRSRARATIFKSVLRVHVVPLLGM